MPSHQRKVIWNYQGEIKGYHGRFYDWCTVDFIRMAMYKFRPLDLLTRKYSVFRRLKKYSGMLTRGCKWLMFLINFIRQLITSIK